MPRLSDLKAKMKDSSDPAGAAQASRDLAAYLLSYNEEYNANLATREKAVIELDAVSTDPSGVDTSGVLRLQSLILTTEARMKVQDEKLIAFHADALSVEPPSDTVAGKVKKLSAEVSQMQVKAAAVENIIGLLTKLAQAVDKMQNG